MRPKMEGPPDDHDYRPPQKELSPVVLLIPAKGGGFAFQVYTHVSKKQNAEF